MKFDFVVIFYFLENFWGELMGKRKSFAPQLHEICFFSWRLKISVEAPLREMLQEVLQRVALFCGVNGERPKANHAVAHLLARHYIGDENAKASGSAANRPRLNAVLAQIVAEFAVSREKIVVLSRTGLAVLTSEASGLRMVRELPPPSVDCAAIAASRSTICGACGLGVVVLDSRLAVQRTYLTAHSHPVLCVAVTEDGQHVATGGTDAAVVFWSVDGGPLSFLSAHNDWVRFLRFTRGAVGKLLLVSAGDDGLVVLWDPMIGAEIARLEHFHGQAIRAMDVSPRLLVASGDQQSVSLDLLSPAAMAPRGSFFVFSIDTQAVTIAAAGGPMTIHQGTPTTCLITANEEYLVSAAEDETLSVSSLTMRSVLWSCSAFVSKRRCMSFMNVATAIRILACPPLSSVIIVAACTSDGDVLQWIIDPRSNKSALSKKMLALGPLVDMDIVKAMH